MPTPGALAEGAKSSPIHCPILDTAPTKPDVTPPQKAGLPSSEITAAEFHAACRSSEGNSQRTSDVGTVAGASAGVAGGDSVGELGVLGPLVSVGMVVAAGETGVVDDELDGTAGAGTADEGAALDSTVITEGDERLTQELTLSVSLSAR